MGGSSSSTNTVTSNTNIVTNDQLNLLNKNTNDFVANTVVNQAATCSAGMNLSQAVDLSNFVAGEDFNLNTNQSQEGKLTFSCVQVSKFQSDIANGILEKMTAALSSTYSTTALDKLSQTAKASAQSQFAGTGPSVSANTNANYTFNQTTNIDKNLTNVLENSITNNLNLNDISDCIASINNSQTIAAVNAHAGRNAKIVINQNQAANIVTKCIQEKGTTNKITDSAVRTLDLQVQNTATIKKTSDITQTTASKSESVGLFQSVGQGISTAAQGIGTAIGDVFGAMLGMWAMPIVICVVICCCLTCCILAFKMLSGGSDKGSGNQGGQEVEAEEEGQKGGNIFGCDTQGYFNIPNLSNAKLFSRL